MGISYNAKLVCGCMITASELKKIFPDKDDIAEHVADLICCEYVTGGGEYTDEETYYVFHVTKTKVSDGVVGLTGLSGFHPEELRELVKLYFALQEHKIPATAPFFFAVLQAY